MHSIYGMMGKYTYPCMKDSAPQDHVDTFFQVKLISTAGGRMLVLEIYQTSPDWITWIRFVQSDTDLLHPQRRYLTEAT